MKTKTIISLIVFIFGFTCTILTWRWTEPEPVKVNIVTCVAEITKDDDEKYYALYENPRGIIYRIKVDKETYDIISKSDLKEIPIELGIPRVKYDSGAKILLLLSITITIFGFLSLVSIIYKGLTHT